jgi:F0F1-type ATP synthase delta subunit
VRVVPELLGGVVFRSGDTVYDGSVRRRLDQMKRRLLAAEVSTD